MSELNLVYGSFAAPIVDQLKDQGLCFVVKAHERSMEEHARVITRLLYFELREVLDAK